MTKKIILIEDDHDSCLLFNHVLTNAAYVVDHYFDGKDFLNASDSTCDLYIFDQCLPSIDGAALTKFVKTKNQTTATPVLIISANHAVQEKAQKAGASAFLTKPFEVSAFLGIVSQLIHDPSYRYFPPRYTEAKPIAYNARGGAMESGGGKND
jgi:DNA-binding response OmpR family regulator